MVSSNIKFPYKMIDLTHSLKENIPAWDLDCSFKNEITLDYSDCKSTVKFRVQKISMPAGIGTHIDSPSHCGKNGATISEIPLEKLISPCVVIDVSRFCQRNKRISWASMRHGRTIFSGHAKNLGRKEIMIGLILLIIGYAIIKAYL